MPQKWPSTKQFRKLVPGVLITFYAAHKAVNTRSINPIGDEGDVCEVLLSNNLLRNLGSLVGELVGTMRRLAQEDEACTGSHLKQRVRVRSCAPYWVGGGAERITLL